MEVCCLGKNNTFFCVYYHFWAPSWLSLFVSHKDGISSLEQSLCALSIRNTSWFVYLYSTGQAEVRIYFLKKTDLMWKVILKSFTVPVALDKHQERQCCSSESPTSLRAACHRRGGGKFCTQASLFKDNAHIRSTKGGLIWEPLNPGFQFLILHCIVIQKSAQQTLQLLPLTNCVLRLPTFNFALLWFS